MLMASAVFANQSLGLPILNNAKLMMFRIKPAKKVTVNATPSKTLQTKQRP